jgi:phage baseplate assembly protein W
MTVIAAPFYFNSQGGVTKTSDQSKIIQQKIIDALVTGPLERVMRPGYGANAYGLLYEPIDGLLEADFTQDALTMINQHLSDGQAVSLDIRSSYSYGAYNSTTAQPGLEISVRYKIPPFEIGQFSFHVADPSTLTEETAV